jgi:hypothetical protein
MAGLWHHDEEAELADKRKSSRKVTNSPGFAKRFQVFRFALSGRLGAFARGRWFFRPQRERGRWRTAFRMARKKSAGVAK